MKKLLIIAFLALIVNSVEARQVEMRVKKEAKLLSRKLRRVK